MNDCKKIESLMERALYQELTPAESEFFHRHIASCTDCSGEFNEYKNILGAVAAQPRAEADEVFMNTLWESIEPELKGKDPTFASRWKEFIDSLRFDPSWKYQLAGGIAILVAGIFIGNYLTDGDAPDHQPVVTEKSDAEIRQTMADIEALKYIQRSKVLMLGLMNFDPATDDAETVNLDAQKRISGELLTQAAELKTVLREPSQRQMKKLVSDIELILMQIANLDAKYDLTGIEIIREGVKSKGIILKIHIQEMKKEEKKMTPENTNINNDTKTI